MPIRIIKRTTQQPAKPEKIKLPGVLDSECRFAVQCRPNAAVPWWLMASYLYYTHDMSLLSDGLYDQLARDMLDDWDLLDHRHKHLITSADLIAGSLHRLNPEEYPITVRGAAAHLVYTSWLVKINVRHDGK